MSVSYVAINAAYQTLVDALTDTLENAKAQMHLDRWKEIVVAADALGARDLQSYTIAGRTFTYSTASDLRIVAEQELAKLEGVLGYPDGNVATYADFGGGQS